MSFMNCKHEETCGHDACFAECPEFEEKPKDITIKIGAIIPGSEATGDVAYLKMPIPLSSMADMGKFLDKAYGPDAICVEDPNGWLKISKPEAAINGFEMAQRLKRTNDALQKATQ